MSSEPRATNESAWDGNVPALIQDLESGDNLYLTPAMGAELARMLRSSLLSETQHATNAAQQSADGASVGYGKSPSGASYAAPPANQGGDCTFLSSAGAASSAPSAGGVGTDPCHPECATDAGHSNPCIYASSDTPRTDAYYREYDLHWNGARARDRDFARQLEREVKQWRDLCHDERNGRTASSERVATDKLPWIAPFTFDTASGNIRDADGRYVCPTWGNVSDKHNALIAVALSEYVKSSAAPAARLIVRCTPGEFEKCDCPTSNYGRCVNETRAQIIVEKLLDEAEQWLFYDNRLGDVQRKDFAVELVKRLSDTAPSSAASATGGAIDAKHAAYYRMLRAEGLLDGHVVAYEGKHDLDESDAQTHDYMERCDAAMEEIIAADSRNNNEEKR